jgi:NHL repeat-containing protein
MVPRLTPLAALFASLMLATQPARLAALRVEILTSLGGLPPHVSGAFEDPSGFRQGPAGDYFVFDRRGHSVYRIPPDRSSAQRIISIGQEDGRVIDPTGFDMAEDGRIVVADAPRGRQRIQVFDAAGMRLAGFFLQGQPAARIVMGGMMLNGTGSIQFSQHGLLISHPESGGLITTYSIGGYGMATIGNLRPSGFEQDRELHLAMNAGFSLADPAGGYYYVFMAGRPAFRKYDASGALVFERTLQGVELDPLLAAQPTEWPRRRVQDREVPFVAPLIRAAAVSPAGELWLSLSIPYTYVYDAQGDKIRTLQFRAAGIVGPTSFGFTRRGTVLVTPGCYEFSARS